MEIVDEQNYTFLKISKHFCYPILKIPNMAIVRHFEVMIDNFMDERSHSSEHYTQK
jgi:hypothetical protein